LTNLYINNSTSKGKYTIFTLRDVLKTFGQSALFNFNNKALHSKVVSYRCEAA